MHSLIGVYRFVPGGCLSRSNRGWPSAHVRPSPSPRSAQCSRAAGCVARKYNQKFQLLSSTLIEPLFYYYTRKLPSLELSYSQLLNICVRCTLGHNHMWHINARRVALGLGCSENRIWRKETPKMWHKCSSWQRRSADSSILEDNQQLMGRTFICRQGVHLACGHR
jgi:hypothetical protein